MTIDATAAPETTIAQLARTPGASTAARLRQALALEAVADPTWVAIDRRRRQAGVAVAEQRPVVPLALVEHARRGADASKRSHSRSSLSKPWLRIPLLGVGGIAVGALIVNNPLVPQWYGSWADFGPAVGTTGIVFVTLTLALMYGFGSQSLPSNVRAATDIVVAGYAAIAVHPLAAVLLWSSAAVVCADRRRRQRRDSEQEAKRVRELVDLLVNSPTPRQADGITIGWGRFSGTPPQAADLLCARALELEGHDLGAEDPWMIVDNVAGNRDIIDSYACVLAAELWLLACDATEFEQAASIGPAALGAYAAILARAQGEPADGMPPFNGQPAWPATIPAATAKIALFKNVVENEAGSAAFREVAARAAADLAWGGGGDDRCARMARHLLGLAS